jgi:signal transduction histidine kinase
MLCVLYTLPLRCARSLMHPDDIARVRAGLAAVQERGGSVSSNQYRRQHKEGHYVYVSGCSYLKQGRFYVQEHSIDSEIRRQSIEEKQTYIGTTAHDLKTPVAVFQSSLDLLQQSKLTEEQDAITQQAQAAVDLMQMTVDQAMEVMLVTAYMPMLD